MRVRITVLTPLASLLAPAQVALVIDAVGHAVGQEQDGVDAIQAALAAGAKVNERDKSGWTPLMHAALECRADEMKLLLGRGADPTLRGNTTENGGFTESGLDPMLLAGRGIG